MKRTILFFILIVIFSTLVLPRFHPKIKWRETTRDRFIVIFPPGYEQEAAYTLDSAEKIYNRQAKMWKTQITGKIRVLLTDVNDFANGYATFFPFNLIGVYLFHPEPDSVLGSCRDWINMALAHEMTHLFVMNIGAGFTRFMRKIFGSLPVFYPGAGLPAWVHEGLSVYWESQIDAGGRLRSPDYNIMLAEAARGGKIPDWKQLTGNPTHWPGPSAKYLYGSMFLKYLKKTLGEAQISEFIKDYSRYPFPFPLPDGQNLKYYRVLKRRWPEFKEQAYRGKNDDFSGFNVITDSGFNKRFPVNVGAGKIVCALSDYQHYPGLYELDLVSGKASRLFKKTGINGINYCSAQKKINFSAVEIFKSYFYYSDIYCYDLINRKVRCLSKGKRLLYPVPLGEKGKIVCVKRIKNRSRLVTLIAGKETVISQEFLAIGRPSVSPNMKFLAAAVKNRRGTWRIALFDKQGNFIRYLTTGKNKCYYPRWKDNEHLYFIAEDNITYRLAEADIPNQTIHLISDQRLPAVKYYDCCDSDNRVLVSFYNSKGFDIGALNLSACLFKEKIVTKPHTGSDSETIPAKTISRRYNFLRDLAPRYFSPYFRNGGSEYQPGFLLSGTDATETHTFSAGIYYGIKVQRFNWDFDYSFRGLYPSLRFRYRDLWDWNGNYREGNSRENRKNFEAGLTYPLSISQKKQFYIYSSVILDRFKIISDIESQEIKPLKLNGIKIAFIQNSAKSYYDSISPTDGMRFSLSYLRDARFLGSDYNSNTASFEFQHYISLLRPNTLAVRFGISDSWGESKRLVAMGGFESKLGYVFAGENMFDLMRGYPRNYFIGSGGWLFNLEYRISLWKIENSFWFFPGFERIYLTLFTDVGNLWLEKKEIDPAISLGAEISLVVSLHGIKWVFSGGVAVSQRPEHDTQFYIRMGKSF